MLKNVVIAQLERILGRDFSKVDTFPLLSEDELTKLRAEKGLLELVYLKNAQSQSRSEDKSNLNVKLPQFSSVKSVTVTDILKFSSPPIKSSAILYSGRDTSSTSELIAQTEDAYFEVINIFNQITTIEKSVESVLSHEQARTNLPVIVAESREKINAFASIVYSHRARLLSRSAYIAAKEIADLIKQSQEVKSNPAMITRARLALLDILTVIQYVSEHLREIKKVIGLLSLEKIINNSPQLLDEDSFQKIEFINREISKKSIELEKCEQFWQTDLIPKSHNKLLARDLLRAARARRSRMRVIKQHQKKKIEA